MIIGIDASRANRDHKTGTEWYSYYIIRWLAKLDDKNEYILYTDEPLTGGLLDLGTKQYSASDEQNEIKIDSKGFQEIKSPHNNFKVKILKWPIRHFWTLGRLSLEMILHRPDVLYIPAHTIPLFFPKRTVNTIHDVGFVRDHLLYRNEKMGTQHARVDFFINLATRIFTLNKYGANTLDFLSWSTKYSLKKSSNIISVSNFTKQEIKDIYGGNTDKITVIHNGYNSFLYKKSEDTDKIKAVLDKYDLPKSYILYVGRLEKKKNTPALIEAYANLKERNKSLEQKLVLVGDASYGFDEVKYVIQEFNLDYDVIMPGWVDEEDISYIYNAASSFIFPSRYEGFGIPLLQAMACETPIAASMATSIPEVVGDAAILFNPTEVDEIAKAMEDVTLNGEIRKELIEKGKERVKNFSWNKTTRETLNLINSLK